MFSDFRVILVNFGRFLVDFGRFWMDFKKIWIVGNLSQFGEFGYEVLVNVAPISDDFLYSFDAHFDFLRQFLAIFNTNFGWIETPILLLRRISCQFLVTDTNLNWSRTAIFLEHWVTNFWQFSIPILAELKHLFQSFSSTESPIFGDIQYQFGWISTAIFKTWSHQFLTISNTDCGWIERAIRIIWEMKEPNGELAIFG